MINNSDSVYVKTAVSGWDALSSEKQVQYFASFLISGEISGAGGRAYWVWWSGEGWVCMRLKLQCDKVSCTYGGGQQDARLNMSVH